MPTGLTPEARAWQEKYESLGLDELTRARATAKDWTGSISAITGLLALVSLIKGRENIEDLTSGWARSVYLALIIALVFALFAIVIGAVAAQGSFTSLGRAPTTSRRFWAKRAQAAPGPYSPNWQGLREFTHSEAKIVRKQVGWSRGLAVVGALFLIFAVAATWVSPTHGATTPVTVLVVRNDGSFACGDLARSSKPKMILVVEKSGTPATEIPVADVLTVSAAQSCP